MAKGDTDAWIPAPSWEAWTMFGALGCNMAQIFDYSTYEMNPSVEALSLCLSLTVTQPFRYMKS